MRLPFKSDWAAMGQAWDRELSTEHSKRLFDWCSELKEIRTMSTNQLYFENGCSKPETSHLYRCIRISTVHRGIFER